MTMKKRAEALTYSLLRRVGVPEKQLSAYSKKTGERMLLCSILLIVPLIIWDMPLVIKIILQLGYAIMMCVGILLAFDEEKKPH
ncbi:MULTISPECIES: hypothetical protein [Enterobacteriaceae]|uniref:Uncharacterized protein n=2 Tax=Enterobacteriaceae TaxID=543 RepID=A0A9Q4T678_9ENTR|nr:MULTISPECIES: hypothetical protein [Enterobacteriaceae]EKM5066648.1 hypothetical protein [Cronobacter turicensis]EKA0987727.1 hypothetical protein [Cronobacter sakazakii]EKK3990642.1 hypothetical protein [Cronobacter sakazakii]EKK4070636.1 hypothetical protein [Cronobacter sakazakii]EKY1945923.1 hypothetical protein [Cronobacter turicensis]